MKRSFFVALSLSFFLVACGTNAGRDDIDAGTGTEADAGGDASGAGDAGGLDTGEDAGTPDATSTDARPGDAGGTCLDPEDPAVNYVSDDPDGCFELNCGPNASVFTNDCGCGCLEAPSACEYDWDSPLYQLLYPGDFPRCGEDDWACPDGGQRLEGPCGCGCYYEPPICPDPDDPQVAYVAESPDECAMIDFDCAEDFFDGPCGCGCISGETGVCDIDWDSPVFWYYDQIDGGCLLDDWACPNGSTYVDDDCSCGCYFGPEVCPDPESPAVDYVSDDPDECALIDLDCESFYTPCGCGCYDDVPACDVNWASPLNQQVAGTPADCAAIFYTCDEGGEMVADECGCGCVYEPPVCPDPAELGVSYIGESPEECADIDWDCFSPDAESFDGPCGCGCVESVCPDPEASNVQYVAVDPETCAVIDYICPEGWVGFGGGECGCGCEVAECRDDIIFGTSGITEDFHVGNFCDFLVACSPLSLEMSAMAPIVEDIFGEDRCFDGAAFGCPVGTRSSCEFTMGEVTEADVVDVCALSLVASIDRILCGGDL